MLFERLGGAVHQEPHGAVIQFLRPYLGSSRSRSALLENSEPELGKLLGRGPTGLIGLSLEQGASICGDHFWEDMEGLDLPEFERGTAYLAACDEDLASYSDVLYSREEVFGWVPPPVDEAGVCPTVGPVWSTSWSRPTSAIRATGRPGVRAPCQPVFRCPMACRCAIRAAVRAGGQHGQTKQGASRSSVEAAEVGRHLIPSSTRRPYRQTRERPQRELEEVPFEQLPLPILIRPFNPPTGHSASRSLAPRVKQVERTRHSSVHVHIRTEILRKR